jgi:hypothetical protein
MEDELPVVQDCRIRSKQCFDECGRLEPLADVSILSYCILCSCKSMKYHLHYHLEYQASLTRFLITVAL